MSDPVIKVDGREWSIVTPPLPVQMDLMLAMAENRPRVAAAALALCLVDADGTKFAPKLSYKACGCNPLVFGGLVVEHCHGALIPLSEWYTAGLECLAHIASVYQFIGAPEAEEVQALEDFTEAPAAAGTSPGSPSASSGGHGQ